MKSWEMGNGEQGTAKAPIPRALLSVGRAMVIQSMKLPPFPVSCSLVPAP